MSLNEFDGKTNSELRQQIAMIEDEVKSILDDEDSYDYSRGDSFDDDGRLTSEKRLVVSDDYFLSDLSERIEAIKKELKRRPKNKGNPSPITEMPKRLRPAWGGLDGDILEIYFWADDDEAGLHLYLSQDEIREIEGYGVSDDLIDWMRETEQSEIDWTPTLNGTVDDFEIFRITDKVVGRFLAVSGLAGRRAVAGGGG